MSTIIWFESITRNDAGTIKVNYFYINLSLLLRRVAIIVVIIGHPILGPTKLTIEPQPVGGTGVLPLLGPCYEYNYEKVSSIYEKSFISFVGSGHYVPIMYV